MREQSEKALASANEDAQLLLEAAADSASRVAELKAERQSARARPDHRPGGELRAAGAGGGVRQGDRPRLRPR